MPATEVRVGPKGYIHGWIFVGTPEGRLARQHAVTHRALLKSHYQGWRDSLTPSHEKALRFYQSPGFALMNGQLRGRDPAELKKAEHATDSDLERARQASKNLTAAIRKAPPLPRDMHVYRALDASQFKGAKPGDVITEKGFTSTAVDPDVSMVGRGNRQVVARIHLPKGTKAGAGSAREMILPPGARYKVTGVDSKGNLELEYMSPVAEHRTAETGVVSTVHRPFGSPGGPGLFHVKGLQLPAYIQNVAHAFTAHGMPESEAIARAVGVVRDWAEGRTPGGKGHVHPDVRAAAARAIAEWEADRARAHASGGKRMFEERVGPKGYVHGWIFVGAGGLARGHTLKPGARVKAHHPVFGDVEGNVTRVHQNGNLIVNTTSSSRGHGPQTGVAIRREQVTHVGAESAAHLGSVHHVGRNAVDSYGEYRAETSSADQNDLPDSAFAYIEPGGSKDSSGKTVPRSLRHFPVHDAAHARNALSRAPQSPFGEKAMPKIRAAAKKFGIDTSDDDSGSRAYEVLPLMSGGRPELRGTDDTGAERLGGYAAVFGKLSRNLGGFVELVDTDAFAECRSSGWPDVVCRFNHKDDQLLGRAPNTLELRTDSAGLDYTVVPPSGHPVIDLVRRGDIASSSFAFRCAPGDDEWTRTDQNFPLRILHRVELIDVAPVVKPAYPDATAGLRSLALAFDLDLAEVRSLADADELRRLFVRTDSAPPAPQRVSGAAAMTQLMAKRFPAVRP